MRVLVVLALISAAFAESNRIIGGTITNIENYPFMTSMQYLWNHGFYHGCGGTLITTLAVISTGTCFNRNLIASNWRARVGSAALMTGGTPIPVSRLILHHNFNPTMMTSNIAMIRLTTAATLSNTIKIARIAGPNYALPDNLRVYIAGWGTTTENFGGLSNELRHVDVRIVNHALCTDRYADLKSQPGFEYIPPVWPDNVCTGLLNIGGQDACSGDLGGPVVHQGDIVIGVSDWAFTCGDPYYPRVNVRVSSYIQWISQNAS
ncbi:trypsin CFT-1-like [Pararge aegeria]|uniref:trypsin CFT-1-like n=1 Tax=Pararge aegeria TaxID=116150 RepID=UPI0019D313CC|nr:trypsin CFT-1-like [Pararge aegeria]